MTTPKSVSEAWPALSDAAREALYATGYALFSQAKFEHAAELFRMMLQLCPGDERSWLALGECHATVGHDRLALGLYSAGIAMVPKAKRCALARYRALAAQGSDGDAEDAFDVAMRIAEETDDDDFSKMLEQARKATS